ncbi:MAG: helix-turn-helix domain-containing protein [Pseudonocardiaceae bacterium]
MATDRAGLETLRRRLGAHLALCRTAAGVSQPELARAIGRTRSMVSRVEHGTRVMSEALWAIADEVCRAKGALIAEYHTLAEAERDYRAQCRAHRFQMQHSHAQAQLAALTASPAASLRDGDGGWPEMTGVGGELAGELMAVVTKLVRSVGRREAMRLVGYVLAIVGLSGLDTDDYTRLVRALEMPSRVDTRVVESLAVTLAQCKRLDDTLGPCEVLDTVVAQYQIVRRLLRGGCPDTVVKPLKLVQSNMASSIGGYLIDMGHPETAQSYFAHARRAGHAAGNPACAAYAAANASYAAFLRGDTPAALDTAAAARSLAARNHDGRLKALAEQRAAAAYALDGQYGPCMSACARAQDFLAKANGCGVPESLAYWVHEGSLDSQRSLFLCLLDKPKQAVEAASNAQARFDRNFVQGYGRCQVRLGHALVLSKDITQAAHVLGDAANHASLSPRLTTELHTARVLMRPWENTRVVKELDTQLEACGLTGRVRDTRARRPS